MKFGSQRAFFTKVWMRLHGNAPPEINDSIFSIKNSQQNNDARGDGEE